MMPSPRSGSASGEALLRDFMTRIDHYDETRNFPAVKGPSYLSMHLRFDYGETAFRFTFEADGQTWPNSPITPYKGAATLSPFVILEAR